MKMRTLTILQCYTTMTAEGPVEKWEQAPHPNIDIKAVDTDGAIKKARAFLKEKGLAIRSLSVSTDGNLRAMIWKGGRPEHKKDPNWVWKRPASSEPRR